MKRIVSQVKVSKDELEASRCQGSEPKGDNSCIVHFSGDDETSFFSKYGSTIISIWHFSEPTNILILSLLVASVMTICNIHALAELTCNLFTPSDFGA